MKAKGKMTGASDEKLVIPKGPIPSIQPLNDAGVSNGK